MIVPAITLSHIKDKIKMFNEINNSPIKEQNQNTSNDNKA